ncbi:MAG TPA: MarR family transcriptional regulator [Sphingomonas sp.]|nr:MarR family transcriptional regulator [Sphingomonas sp.]
MSDRLAFLIGDVSRLMRRRFDDRARQLGVTRPQWRTLVTLAREEGLQQAALAERIEVEPITLCRMIDRMAEAGLVERRRDPADRRAWNIYLTERSRPLIEQLRAIADDVVDASLDGIAPPERAALNDALARIRANLSAEPRYRETAHG